MTADEDADPRAVSARTPLSENERAEIAAFVAAFRDRMGRVVVGQRELVDGLLLALLAGEHVLLEGLPGVAKSTAAMAVAALLDLSFVRVQFTPDLLPADLTGSEIYRPQTGEFAVRRGPLFANLVLADEINRAPAKVQSALLEAMQERHITIAGRTQQLPTPFCVLATQNPIEQEGTYPLPEAQVDRFLLKLLVPYPDAESEWAIIRRHGRLLPDDGGIPQPALEATSEDGRPLADAQHVQRMQTAVDRVRIAPALQRYLVSLVQCTRDPAPVSGELAQWLRYGVSPRATLGWLRASRVRALLQGRGYVLPDDVHGTAAPVLRHRLPLSYEAEAAGLTADHVVQQLLAAVPLPPLEDAS